MFLKYMEAYGFKSFADKTRLQFSDGITAIVGPNGCGKSNIGDAVRWVLGEQSARLLRGDKMEDVIFKGTEKRKKLSFCEVTLVFDNEDRALPIDYSEVAITRRLYRNGDSEYCINRTTCRLKDIQQLIMDTGIGREGYSIVGQGKIDSILSNKAEDRRGVFEEAAGIVKYKTKKEEAERKLKNTCDNIDRLNDIIGELKSRIEPLQQQSEVAQKYLAIRDELRALEVNFYLYQYDLAEQKKKGYQDSLDAVNGEYETKQERNDSLRTESEHSNECLAEYEQKLEVIRSQVLDLTTRIENGMGESKVLNERYSHITDDITRLQDEIATEEDMKRALIAASGGDGQAAEQKAADIERFSREIDGMDTTLAESDAALQAESDELEKAKNAVVDRLNRLSDVKTNMERYNTMKAAISNRLEQIEHQHNMLDSERTSIQQAIEEQQTISGDSVDKHTELQNKCHDLRAKLDIQLQNKENARKNSEQLSGRLQSLTSRCNMLHEMQSDYESFANSVKALLKACRNNLRLSGASRGVVADLITVPAQYERAIETALGGAIQNIVTPTEDDAHLLIDYLKENRLGRATFLPMSAIKGRTLDINEQNAIKRNGCLGIASELISFDKQYGEIMRSLLGRTIICTDLDVAIGAARACRHSLKMVTLDGDVINAGGSMSGGSQQSKLTSILSRNREIEETEKQLAAVKEQAAVAAESIKSSSAAAEETSAALAVAEKELHENEVLLARDNERINKLNADLAQNKAGADALNEEAAGLNETLKEIESNLAAINNAQGDIEQSNSNAEQDISQKSAQYNKHRLERERLANIITEKKIQLAAYRQELAGMKANAERAKRELASAEMRIAQKQQRILDAKAQLEQLDSNSLEHSRALDTLKETLAERNEVKTSLEKQRDELNDTIHQHDRERRELEQDLLNAQEKKHKLELALQKVDSDISLMEQRIWDEYELTYSNAAELRTENFKVTGVQTEINRLRKDINALGNVNVNAIEEYVATKERYDNLSAQLTDLQKAESDLHKLIGDVVREMETRFTSQFAIINKYFTETFKELFGGGRAELRLKDGENVLESGIEIVAQPPGKTLETLSPLSGGEKALTAIAILFAMLRLKPTPFCILDEIEAALDESNVYNFASYLRNFSKSTQFIVVTHRKPTMEEADNLYGVSMEEKGISKIVSVKLSAN